jgi:hemolysin activation/secretion protein
MGGEFSLFGRLAAQWANRDLDSSKGFGPGGATGVRAFPGGEAYGDAGFVTQLEARKSGALAVRGGPAMSEKSASGTQFRAAASMAS